MEIKFELKGYVFVRNNNRYVIEKDGIPLDFDQLKLYDILEAFGTEYFELEAQLNQKKVELLESNRDLELFKSAFDHIQSFEELNPK